MHELDNAQQDLLEANKEWRSRDERKKGERENTKKKSFLVSSRKYQVRKKIFLVSSPKIDRSVQSHHQLTACHFSVK